MNKKISFIKKLFSILIFSFIFMFAFWVIFINETKAEGPITVLSEEWCNELCEEPYSGGVCAYCVFGQIEGEGGCVFEWGYQWRITKQCYIYSTGIWTTGYCGPYYAYAYHIPVKRTHGYCEAKQEGISGYGCAPVCVSPVEDNPCFSSSAIPDPDYYLIGYRYNPPTLEELGLPSEPVLSSTTTSCFRFEIGSCEYLLE
ncbi:MAG: hypothetical protein PHH17_01405 [Candidatus Pacebacteria bacterium]|nr:hypothetical protein [Candidatus Paceibacterota bacterium]MDD5445850.1 hypothetical protein [Candidatus Paceibacterota bacterium]